MYLQEIRSDDLATGEAGQLLGNHLVDLASFALDGKRMAITDLRRELSSLPPRQV
jgi:hypothetical protein